MGRMTAVVVLISIATSGLPARAQAPPGNAVLRPDAAYRPRVGDQAEITLDGVPAATTRALLDEFVKSRDAGDRINVERLSRLESVVTLDRRTSVSIVQIYQLPRLRPEDPLRGFSMGEYQKAMREVIAREGNHPAGSPVEVRVLDGRHAGKMLTVEEQHVGRLTWQRTEQPAGTPTFSNPPRRKPRPVPKPMPPRPVDPATQAAATLQLGKNLRFEGRRDAAIEYFRKAITQAPDSPAATEAKSILKAMGAR